MSQAVDDSLEDVAASRCSQRYCDEIRRQALLRALVGCWVPVQLVVEHDLPVANLSGLSGLVELDVAKLKLARDVSPN